MPAGKPRRRERTPEQQADAAAARQERLEDLHRQLADGVAALRDGEAWRGWLDVAKRFHHYSFGNQLLIAAQKPDATLVAGYGAWNALGRQVRRGEKALWVLAPVTGRGQLPDADGVVDASQLDPMTGTPAEPSPGSVTRTGRAVRGFTSVAVFDVSQTDGDPLPTPPRPQLLAGQAPPGLWDALTRVVTESGFTVERSPDAKSIGEANGVTDYVTRTVTVRADVDAAQAVKTLAHEAGHVLLHNPQDRGESPVCRDLIEVEAESVAYLVAAHHGLDTSGYTFAYIAGWAGRDDDAVTNTARRVLDAARTLIEATDPVTVQGQSPSAVVSLAAREATEAADAAAIAQERLANLTRDRTAHLDTLRAVNSAAQQWFLRQAETGKEYAEAVTARGHTVDAALGFGVGWAPRTWTGLVDHLRGAGFTNEELQAAGVATAARNGRLIDRFRGRVTFPIHHDHGVVGFTARDVTGNPEAPKYLNTPATALYDKSRVLFGTQHIPRESADHGSITTVVLTEGPWDALAVTATEGADLVGLAACGTAVTDHHLDLAQGAGYALVLAPDADSAGLRSLGRTLDLLAARCDPHPLALKTPSGSDLADVFAHGGAFAIRRVLAGARPAGLVFAEQTLYAHPPADTAESRVASARVAAAHTSGMTPADHGSLRELLIARAGVGLEAASALVIISPAPTSRAGEPTAQASPSGVGARSGLRR